MPIIDFGQVMKQIQGAAESAKTMAENAIKEIKLPTAEEISEGAKSVLNDVKGALQPPVKVVPAELPTAPEVTVLPTRAALKLVYYMMAADGNVFHSEEEKFDAIAREFDPKYEEHRESVIGECKAQINNLIDPEDYFEVLREGVDEAILLVKPTEDSFITPKLLVWDLLTVAYSDEHYDEAERKLMKYIARKTNVDKATFLEMENSYLAIQSIEKELAWIKTTNRPYLTIEAMVNELTDRKAVIFDGVKELIRL